MTSTETDERYLRLGHGILLRLDGSGESAEIIDGIVHYRFMDRLYLPAPTNELDVESIKVINRWREDVLQQSELPHRDRVRRVATMVIGACGTRRLLEIGPGKYPLVTNCAVEEYVALEIDDEAREHNLATHLRCVSDPAQLIPEADCIDTVVALFSMQFHVSVETLQLLARVRSDSILFINVPTADEQLVKSRVQQFEQIGATVTSFDLSPAGVHDILLVAGYPDAGLRLQRVIRAVTTEIAKEWPCVPVNERRSI